MMICTTVKDLSQPVFLELEGGMLKEVL